MSFYNWFVQVKIQSGSARCIWYEAFSRHSTEMNLPSFPIAYIQSGLLTLVLKQLWSLGLDLCKNVLNLPSRR